MISPYLDKPRRAYWKVLADMGRADYFRWAFTMGCKFNDSSPPREIVLSVGKVHDADGMKHASSADTCEVLMWCRDKPMRDLAPEDISSLLEPWSRFFSNEACGPIALHMPDSILTSLVFALDYYYDQVYFRHSLLNVKG